jgi:hypothetical protein
MNGSRNGEPGILSTKSYMVRRNQRRRTETIDADVWTPPMWVEDVNELRCDWREQSRRYGRRFLDQNAGCVSPYDAAGGPLALEKAAPMLAATEMVPKVAASFRSALADWIPAALSQIPNKDWRCTGRENVRPKGQDVTQQLTLGLLSTASY